MRRSLGPGVGPCRLKTEVRIVAFPDGVLLIFFDRTTTSRPESLYDAFQSQYASE
jgi:hypothetical protein